MTKEQERALLKPFAGKDIQWKIQTANREWTRGLTVAYINRTAIEERLDLIFGCTNWRCNTSAVALSNGDAVHICYIQIRESETKEWIGKSNAAGNTSYEAIKGGASDAFKRAASTWGIGRYLRRLDPVWVDIKDKRITESEMKRLNSIYEKFLERGQTGNFSEQHGSASASPTTDKKKTAGELWTINKLVTQNGNMALSLLNEASGELQSCLVLGTPDLKQGQKITNVEFLLTERHGTELRLLENFKAA